MNALQHSQVDARTGLMWAHGVGVVVLALMLSACGGGGGARQPPGAPPKPASVSVAEPGGDAHNPHRAALERLLEAPWGSRNDKDDQIHAPTPDWENWKRVRFFGVKHFTGFRYGDDHHVMALLFVQPVPAGESTDSRSCMKRFEAWGWPKVEAFEVGLSPLRTKRREYRGKPMLVKSVDGYVDLGLERKFFSGAWAAYPDVYPDACLIYAVAIPWRDEEALAKKLRDRWVLEGFQRMHPLTKDMPVRK
ncbi:MAG: hypothetical protein R3B07_21005 [Polyangiaceae bacterium]